MSSTWTCPLLWPMPHLINCRDKTKLRYCSVHRDEWELSLHSQSFSRLDILQFILLIKDLDKISENLRAASDRTVFYLHHLTPDAAFRFLFPIR